MFKVLEEQFEPILADFFASNAIKRVTSGALSVAEYQSYLKQVYFYVRENPQLQALATIYFRGRQRDMVKSFYAHASSEIGHEQLFFKALNDYVTLGGDASLAPYQNPLPATTALTSFAFYQIYNQNPLGYLGYLYFLEFVPTASGETIAKHLLEAGVPESAMTFLRDHMEIDVGHNRLMQKYAEKLVKTEADVDAVHYAMKTTGYLYAQMLEAAFDDVTKQTDTGWSWEELNADGLTPAKLTEGYSFGGRRSQLNFVSECSLIVSLSAHLTAFNAKTLRRSIAYCRRFPFAANRAA